MILNVTIDTSDATFPNGDPGFEEWSNSHAEERANKLREELIARALSHCKLRAVAFNYPQHTLMKPLIPLILLLTSLHTHAQCFSISPQSVSLPPRASTGMVSVISSSGCLWTSASLDSWLSITSGSSGAGNSSVAYAAAANTNAISRNGTLIIAGQNFSVTQSGDSPGQFRWGVDIFGTSSSGQAFGNAIKSDYSGNVIVVGNFSGSVDFGGTIVTTTSGSSVFIAKYSSTGALLWVKSFEADSQTTCVGVDKTNNIIITGYFTSSVNFGGSMLTSRGGGSYGNVFLAKFSPSGSHIWSRSFGGDHSIWSKAMVIDKDDNVLVSGNFQYPSANFGAGDVAIPGTSAIFVAKYAGTGGVYQWARTSGNGGGTTYGMATDSLGNVTITGSSPVDLGGGTFANPSSTWLVKLSPTGANVWSKSAAQTGAITSGALAGDNADNIILAGALTGTVDFGTGTLSAVTGSSAFYIARFNSAGVCNWAKKFGGLVSYGREAAFGVSSDTNSNISVTGRVSGDIDFGNGVLQLGNGNYDMFMARYTPQGAYMWASRFPISLGKVAESGVACDSEGSSIATGNFTGSINFGGGSWSSPGYADGFVVKRGP